MVADEEQKVLGWDWKKLKDWPVLDHGESLGGRRANDVGVAAGDGADFVWIGRGPEAGGN
jgi:hypothetical protein